MYSFCGCFLTLLPGDIRYPKYTDILLKALDIWYYDQEVTTPILKLMAEIVQNRSQVRYMLSCYSLTLSISNSTRRSQVLFQLLTKKKFQYDRGNLIFF